MWIADGWRDYEVLDAGDGEKLERWGSYILRRPDPQVIWSVSKGVRWKKISGHYHRSKQGGGSWEFFDLPEQWDVSYPLPAGLLTFHLKPFSFKHTGLFPEQAVNWEWFSELIRGAGRPVKVLNLFAYTGGATIAAAAAGASVTHVDASKGMTSWAKENAASSGLGNAPIRWIVDDCVKFVEREIRRGKTYDAVIMARRARCGRSRTRSTHSFFSVRSCLATIRFSSLLIVTQPVFSPPYSPTCSVSP